LAYLKTVEEGKSPLPELIFLDINMPKMNGWEFLEAYKELPLMKENKAVLQMLTTSSNPDDMDKATNYPDVKDYLIKPMMGDLLVEILEKHFPEHI